MGQPTTPLVRLTPPTSATNPQEIERLLVGWHSALSQLKGCTAILTLHTGGVSGMLKTLTITAGLITDYTLEP